MEEENKNFQKVVDLDKLIKNSNNSIVKAFPRFLRNKMKKILCQEELNSIHNKIKHKNGIDYINSILQELDININIHNEKALKNVDRCIFVANHPLGAIDALAFLHCINKVKGYVVSPSNQFFEYIPNLHPLIVGVNVFGKTNKEQINAVNKIYMSDVQIMIFPAGLVSRKINGKIQDLPWKKSFISKATQTKRCVIPTFITGKNSSKFYRIAKLRKFFRLKMPVETLYLPQEMLKNKGITINLVFGEPIDHSSFDNSKTPHQWAQYVREKVYELEKEFK